MAEILKTVCDLLNLNQETASAEQIIAIILKKSSKINQLSLRLSELERKSVIVEKNLTTNRQISEFYKQF